MAFAAAAIDPAKWDHAMEAIARTIDCKGAALVPIHSRVPTMPFSSEVGELSHEYLNSGWQTQDYRYRGLPIMLRRGSMGDLDFATPEELAANPFYQEFLRPLDCLWFAGLKIEVPGVELRALTIQRSAVQGPFSSDELMQFAALSHSLSSSAAMAHALSHARAEATLAAFEVSGTPIFLVGFNGDVVMMNPCAERLLGVDIKIAAKQLVSWSQDSNSALASSLKSLLRSFPPRHSMPAVTLPRLDVSKRPMLAHVIRLPPVTQDVFGAARAAIIVSDLQSSPSPPIRVLREAFSFTEKEALLARQLTSGKTLEEACALLEFSKETGKSHLKAIFEKTDTHRQGELISILARVIDKRCIES